MLMEEEQRREEEQRKKEEVARLRQEQVSAEPCLLGEACAVAGMACCRAELIPLTSVSSLRVAVFILDEGNRSRVEAMVSIHTIGLVLIM